jgi:ubiquinone/menaquinone biosynthesis C-methylase UbiE
MGADGSLYDEIGVTYSASRREDPRLAAAIRLAIGNATSLVNVGAGTGDYEPTDMEVVAIEPSTRMIEQRAPHRAPAIAASAEQLPLDDDSVDVALAVLSDHHWSDRARGLRELRRVARRRVVLVNADPSRTDLFWLTRDYLPSFVDLIPPRFRKTGTWESDLRETLDSAVRTDVLPVPHDCIDGFYQAYWRRPSAYLSSALRRNISVFHRLDAAQSSPR